MDYNLGLGDTFNTTHYKYVVVDMDSTLINSVQHKVWYFKANATGFIGSSQLCVIEGIGCIQDPVYMFRDFSSCVECGQPYIYCFSNQGITPPIAPPVTFLDNTTSCSSFPAMLTQSLPPVDYHFDITPNPASALLTISSDNKIENIVIYDILGQTVYQSKPDTTLMQIDILTLKSGVYFIKINGVEIKILLKE